MFFRADFRIIWHVEFEYIIRFLDLLLKVFRKIDFLQNMHVFETATFDFKTPFLIQQVADPLKSIYF